MEVLLPVLLFLVPVFAVVLLATAFGRRLSGSCGGQGGGDCGVCGRSAAEIKQAKDADPEGACR